MHSALSTENSASVGNASGPMPLGQCLWSQERTTHSRCWPVYPSSHAQCSTAAAHINTSTENSPRGPSLPPSPHQLPCCASPCADPCGSWCRTESGSGQCRCRGGCTGVGRWQLQKKGGEREISFTSSRTQTPTPQTRYKYDYTHAS